MKALPAGTELVHTDGRTDMTKVIVAFGDFAGAPKNRVETKSETNFLATWRSTTNTRDVT